MVRRDSILELSSIGIRQCTGVRGAGESHCRLRRGTAAEFRSYISVRAVGVVSSALRALTTNRAFLERASSRCFAILAA
jgi:hypothetical protein